MTRDAFAALGLERHPWLDPAELKSRFLARASALHPDSDGGDAAAFAELNQCFALLRDPADRLRHLLELEFPKAKKNSLPPPDERECFEAIALQARRVRELQARRKTAGSALARAALAPELKKELAACSALHARLEQSRSRLESGLKNLPADWQAAGADQWAEVAAFARYLERASHQLRETEFLLALLREQLSSELS